MRQTADRGRRTAVSPRHGGTRTAGSLKVAAPSAERGFTLLEILAVIVIFSMLLGFSVALLQGANKDLGVAAAANHVVALFRAAHDVSRASSSPAWVVINRKENSIHVLVKETVGEWHLEEADAAEGAFGRKARVNNGNSAPGRVGKGVHLAANGSVGCGELPLYRPDQGLSIELWYLRRTGRVRGVLASAGNLVEIASEADGRVVAKAGSVAIHSGTFRIPLESWCRLQFVHSGREARLSLNGREVARAAGTLNWTAGVPFTVGGQGFAGIVDEIRLGAVVPRDPYFLPAECSFELPPESGKADEVVVAFDSEGRLDPPETFTVTLRSSAAKETLSVGPGGTLQR
jgi:prepilin-type N-terminal cleavage/methylation domain-containing protein